MKDTDRNAGTPVRSRRWVEFLVHLTTKRSRAVLIVVGLLTLISIILSEHIVLRMTWTDLLPEHNPDALAYRNIQDRFGEPSLVVALEGERDAIAAMARDLEPRLRDLECLDNVLGEFPLEFMRDHGFMLIKPDQFERTLRMLRDWTLTGALRGLNDDFEGEYTSDEGNLRRDEVTIARTMLGLTRTLELLAAGATGEVEPAAMAEAADAFALGEPWTLSFDRQMLLIMCTPVASMNDIDLLIATTAEVETVVEEVAADHPAVTAALTGMAKISQDEMNSVGVYTILLSLLALVLIYILLTRTLGGKLIPLVAVASLLVGVMWAMGAIMILFGSMNVMTAMMALVLLGLGIDFSIHLVTRFRQERDAGVEIEEALRRTIGGSGVGVITGALTTALAFFTLVVGETVGVHEFGVSAGLGVLLTLLAVFLILPTLLVLRERRIIAHGGDPSAKSRISLAGNGYGWIGTVAATGYRRPALFLGVTLVIMALSFWASRKTAFEYDFLELEAKGLRSVELQREIPRRFGTSDHAAWITAASVEESRRLKDAFEDLPDVAEVNAISDYLPSPGRLESYTPALRDFRERYLNRSLPAWRSGDGAVLNAEVDRLWDNLDLMSNLAYMAGLDRIVQSIDVITGVDSETGEVDPAAILPTLSRRLADGVDDRAFQPYAEVWAQRLHATLGQMSRPEPVEPGDIPGHVARMFEARQGDGYLIHIVPRGYLFDKEQLERFTEQTENVDPAVVSTEKLFLVMIEETIADGREAVLLAIGVIMLLLMIHFRGPTGLLAMVPLVAGVLGMLGLMYLIGEKYNYINFIATPIILGIGIDDGVHALHRYREEAGRGSDRTARSFRLVGKAILLTSLTTMIGFGSVAFYEMRGMASFGRVLFMGVGMCFVATIFVLPPLLRIFHPGEREGEAAPTTAVPTQS